MTKRDRDKDQDLIEIMEFEKIDKISDDVFNLGSNVILRFNVTLSKKLPNLDKQNFHKEFEFTNKNQEKSVTIRRSFDFFLSLENIFKESNGAKLFIRIGVQEFFLFKQTLEIAASWFSDPKYAGLYIKDIKGKIRLVEPIPETILTDLPMGRSLRLVPTVIDKYTTMAEQRTGIRMYYSEESNGYADIELGKFMGLVYLISNFNMYQNALSVVNYLGRPSLGTNRVDLDEVNGPGYSFGTYSDNSTETKAPTGINGRQVGIGKTVQEQLNDLEG